jgi:D-alanyl-D-alanine carboxypeptidase
MSRIIMFLLASMLLSFTLPADVALTQADKLDNAIRAELAKRHIAGASVAVVRQGKVAVARGYGMANIERNVPATPDAVYQLASLSKPFTATAIIMLVEEGKISLHEKAARYLPQLPAACREITVRQLLTHTSGVRRDLRKHNLDTFTEEEFWRRLTATPMDFNPGEKNVYSNTGYILLGEIIEAVSGKSYEAFLAERIFKPLGMTATKVCTSLEMCPRRASGYEWQGNGFHAVNTLPPESPDLSLARNASFGAGSGGLAYRGALASSVIDLAKFDAALSTEQLLKRSTLEQMWTPVKLNDGTTATFGFNPDPDAPPFTYGFGWSLGSYRGHKIIGHGGTFSGFSSEFRRFVDDQTTIIVLCNSKLGPDRFNNAAFLTDKVADLYLVH